MDLKNFYSIIKPIYFVLISLVITSCGTYQYSGNINDGIYNASDSYANTAATDNKEVNNKSNSNNDYYKAAFSEKSLMYSESEPDNEVFTDIENYRTTYNDSIENNYGQWGDYKDSVVINIHSYNNDGFWSSWRYPNWMWNYGYGYGNVWGYGYNNYWSRPHPYYGGFYNPFNPFWGYYDSFYYGYGYAYGYGYYPWWRPYNSWYNYGPYGRNLNTNYSFVSGRRGSRNILSSRSNNISNMNIRDRFNRSSSNSLSDRLSRIDRINNAARVNPNMYNKPFNSTGSSNSLSKPRNDGANSYNNSKPSSNYSKPSNNYSRPNNNYKPTNSNYSTPSYSRPSSGYSPSSGSSFSRGGGMSSGSSSSRGGKSGR